MSIVAIGTDIVSVERIKRVCRRHPNFIDRILAPEELREIHLNWERVAGFFAAKEACSKALGTGIGRVSWHEMQIKHNEIGAPFFSLQGRAAMKIESLGARHVHLSISHERQFAVATVILED